MDRKVIALLAAVLFLVADVVFPWVFSEETMVLLVGLIASYIVGEGLEGYRVLEGLGDLLRSRKFQATLAALIVLLIRNFAPSVPLPKNAEELFIGLIALLNVAFGAEALRQ